MENEKREFRLIPIEPFPRGGLELHEGILKIAKECGVNVLKPLQATSNSKQEKIFSDYIEPYKNQIEGWTSTRLEDIFYCADEIDLKGLFLLEAKDSMIYSSPHFWYLEPFDTTVLKPFLEAIGAAALFEAGKVVIKEKEPISNFFREILKYLNIIKPSLIITSHGTIDRETLTPVEKIALADFARKDKIAFITGWDFIDKGAVLTNTNNSLQPEYLIMEGGTVLYHRENGYSEVKLFNNDELKLVKRAWYALLECTSQHLRETVFMSQADKYSIDVYINPPEDVVSKELKKLREESVHSSSEFVRKLLDEHEIKSIKVDEKTIRIPKNEESAYAAEKINALYRKFMPYKLELKNDFILVTLLSEDYKYTPIQREIRNDIRVIPEILNGITSCVRNKVPIGKRIAPQTDICIDIFVRSKEEIIDQKDVINRIGLSKSKEVIYISKSTRSDEPFIKELSRLKDIWGIDFKAFGDATLPSELRMDVTRIADAKDTIDLIKKLAEVRSRTDLKFFYG
jgi:hypothetical protein